MCIGRYLYVFIDIYADTLVAVGDELAIHSKKPVSHLHKKSKRNIIFNIFIALVYIYMYACTYVCAYVHIRI